MKIKLLSFLFLLLIPEIIFGYGFIIPDTKETGKVLPLALETYEIEVNIENQVAKTKIKQTFMNNFDYEVQGTYVFPIPPDAVFHEFALIINGQKVVGQVLEKDAAQKAYKELVEKTHNPALIEYLDKNMFQAKISGIAPHAKQDVQLEYSQVLKIVDGKVRYFYPMNTEKFNPLPLKIISMHINLKTKEEIKNIYSPSHKIASFRIDDYTAKIGYEETNIVSRNDFLLYYSVSEKDFGLNLLTYKKLNEDGYFLLMIAPPLESKGEIVAKDVAFVIDTSGSMQGQKIIQAKDALKYCIQALGNTDKFFIIRFSDYFLDYTKESILATNENTAEALKFISGIEAGGGTNITETIIHTLNLIPNDNRPFYIVFLTDGISNINFDLIQSTNKDRARIFVFGIGNDVKKEDLTKLAEMNRGIITFVGASENVDMKISGLFAQINKPMLVNVGFDWGGVEVYDIFPRTLFDIYQNTQIIMMGRYSKSKKVTINLKGEINQKKRDFPYEVTFNENSETDDFIPRIWAKQKVDYMLENINKHGETKELKDEIVKLSKQYGFINKYTSFLIKEKEDNIRKDVSAKSPELKMEIQGNMKSSFFGGGSSSMKESESRKETASHNEEQMTKHAYEMSSLNNSVSLKRESSPVIQAEQNRGKSTLYDNAVNDSPSPEILKFMEESKKSKAEAEELAGQVNIYTAKQRVGAIRNNTEEAEKFKKLAEEGMKKGYEANAKAEEARKKLNEALIAKYKKIPVWAENYLSQPSTPNSNDSLKNIAQNSEFKIIGDKTFYLIENFWMDDAFNKDEEIIEIEFSSKEYFDLIAKEPALVKFLSVGEQVIINYKNKNYKIFYKK